MSFLARKVSRPKWIPLAGTTKIGADTISCDLRTSGNTLSFWRFPDVNDDLFHSTALALASSWERLDKIDIIAIPEDALRSHVQLVQTQGHTAVRDLRDCHVDAVELSIEDLVLVARTLASEIRQDSDRLRRLNKKQVKKLLLDAIEKERLSAAELNPKVREGLGLLEQFTGKAADADYRS